jgi:hypothetical protein
MVAGSDENLPSTSSLLGRGIDLDLPMKGNRAWNVSLDEVDCLSLAEERRLSGSLLCSGDKAVYLGDETFGQTSGRGPGPGQALNRERVFERSAHSSLDHQGMDYALDNTGREVLAA